MSIEAPRKFLAFTGIRSDYDLLSGVFRRLEAHPDTNIGLVVSGAHLSATYGRTIDLIEADGVPIVARIESLLDADSPASRLKSASILLQSCIHDVLRFAPDAILYAGDREDALVGALVGGFLNIPTVHFFGGDHATDGNVDNPIRHAVSKLSSIHLVVHEQHKARLLSIGEPERRISVVGNPAIDRFVSTPMMKRHDVVSALGRSDWTDYCVVIMHPILGYEDQAGESIQVIIQALRSLPIPAFVSLPNVDAGNKKIIKELTREQGSRDIHVYSNLERKLFVNLLRHARVLVGNSSAGLLEAPSIPLAAVNVGPRQVGRLSAGNVIFCDQDASAVKEALAQALSPKFQQAVARIISSFGDGTSVETIVGLLMTLDLPAYRFKTEDPLKS